MGIDAKKIDWFDDLDFIMADVLGKAMEEIKHQIKLGICDLWEVKEHGYTITRAELDLGGNPNEFVFVAGWGQNSLEVIEHFEKQARLKGFKGLRIHSSRVGMGRFLERVGFDEAERVYTKDF